MSTSLSRGIARQLTVRAGEWLRDHVFGIATAALVLYCAAVHLEMMLGRLHGEQVPLWDPMLLSGALTYVLALFYGLQIDDKMRRTIVRLVRRGALSAQESKTGGDTVRPNGDGTVPLENAVWQRLREKAGWASLWCGFVVAAVMLLAFLPYMRARGPGGLPLVVLEVCLGYIAGRFLGRMLAYGRFGNCLAETGVQVRAQPGHPDEAAGLQPLGQFYFFQATVVAIPAVFVGSWLVILTFWDTDYGGWRIPYLFLLAVSLLFFNCAFLVPLAFFHKVMQDQKRDYSDDADEISRRITSNKARLATVMPDPERSALEKQLAVDTQRYQEIETMPTWPFDVRIRRKYSLGNILLALPIASFFATQEDPLKEIGVGIESVVRFLAG
jgi:hypothetical protein